MPTLRIHGPAQLTLEDGGALALSAREAALLAWLHLQGPTTRAQLAGLLWPLGDDAKARANLRQTLARLRRAAGDVLAEDDGVLRLAASVALDPAATGELLAGLHFDDAPELAEWLAARRDDARRGRQRERLGDAQARLADGDLDGALALADAVLADEPESEQAWRLRMEICYLNGDRAAAIDAWDACREALRRAFGVAPSAETNELGRLIVASAAPASLSGVLPAALRRPPQLIGRDAVLAQADRALQLRHALVVAGPGGIGKSRVLLALLAAHQPALLVAARAGDRVLPGSSIARLLAAALKRFAPALDEATAHDLARLLQTDEGSPALGSALEQRRVLDAAARALNACARNGLRVLAFDDLQFADDHSIGALRVLLGHWLAGEERGDGGPIPLFAVRDGELSDEGHALLAQLADTRRSARVDLAPLDAADVSALLDELPLAAVAPALDRAALALALHAQVGGNPAFLLESLKSLWLDRFADWQPGQPLPVPDSLRESLRRRLQRLPEVALQVAQLAAVAQRDFSPALAAAALGRAPLALAPLFAALEAAQVFHGHGFSHDLVAEAVHATLPAALQAPLHRLVAEHLIAHQGPPAGIAWHLECAGAGHAAVHWHLTAARAARDRWQLADAARSFEAAALGMQASGIAAADAESTVALAWLASARWWTASGDYARALAALAQGMESTGTRAERMELRASRIVVLRNAGRIAESGAEALALADELQAMPSALEPARLAAALFACVALVPYSDQPQRLAALCEALRDRCLDGPPRARQSFHLSRGLCLSWLARPAEAAVELERARALAVEIGGHGLIVNVTSQLWRAHLMRGNLDAALDAAQGGRQALQAGGFGPDFVLDSLASHGLLHAMRGEPAPALAALRATDPLLEAGDAGLSDENRAMLAIGWLQLGAIARARALLREPHDREAGGWTALARVRLAMSERRLCAPEIDALAGLWPANDTVMGLRRRLLAASVTPPALDAAEALLHELRARQLEPLARLAAVTSARAALAAGQPERARMHADHALALGALADPWIDAPATVWCDAADVLAAAGAASTAAAARQAGRQWIRQAAAALDDTADRAAWLDVPPWHRALLREVVLAT